MEMAKSTFTAAQQSIMPSAKMSYRTTPRRRRLRRSRRLTAMTKVKLLQAVTFILRASWQTLRLNQTLCLSSVERRRRVSIHRPMDVWAMSCNWACQQRAANWSTIWLSRCLVFSRKANWKVAILILKSVLSTTIRLSWGRSTLSMPYSRKDFHR